MSKAKQETHGAKECCTNKEDGLKSTNDVNGSTNNTNTNTLNKLFPVISDH